MVRYILTGWLLVSAPSLALAAEPLSWQVVPEASHIHWQATQNDAPVEGAFEDFSAEIAFHPDALAASHVRVRIDTGSVTTAYDEARQTLKEKEWLYVSEYPQAVFEAQRFSRSGEDGFRAEGTLRIKEQRVPVTLSFRFKEYSPERAVMTGETTLRRTDFNVGWDDTSQVGDKVTLRVKITATRP